MEKLKVLILESFLMKGRGILAEMQHSENGLKQGTVLHSAQTGLSWEVKERVLMDHVLNIQKIFENESTSMMFLKFASQEKRDESIRKLQEKEASGIFQYYLMPLNHKQRPGKEELTIQMIPQ
jgi:hypothetical protein